MKRALAAGSIALAAWTAFPSQQALAGGASVTSPSGGGGDAGQNSGALNVSPGLSFDPGTGQHPTTSVTVERTGSAAPSSGTTNSGNDQISARLGVARGTVRPFGQMLKVIRKAAPGDVVRVKLRQRPHGPWIYDVTVLGPDGHYVQLSLNAADGRIVSRKKR